MDQFANTALSGRPLRYLLTVVLADARQPLTVRALVDHLEGVGLEISGRPSKTVSDALRWEVAKGRVVRVGRSTYRAGSMPRSTAWWIRQHVRGVAA